MGLTQQQVAVAVGVSARAVQKWEAGGVPHLAPVRVLALCNVLQVDLPTLASFFEPVSQATEQPETYLETKKQSFLEVLRLRAEVTQEAVAQAIGVTDHTYRNWVKGRAVPNLTVQQVKVLCLILDCTLEDLPNDFSEH